MLNVGVGFHFSLIQCRKYTDIFEGKIWSRQLQIEVGSVNESFSTRSLTCMKWSTGCAVSACYDWHPTMALMMVELGPNHLGIAIDSELNWKAVKALLHLLITFRRKIQQLYIDSPVIELLVAEVCIAHIYGMKCGSREHSYFSFMCRKVLLL